MTSSPASGARSFEEDFAVRVTEARGRLSRNDERVVDHLRERLEGLAFHTSDSLAQSAGVSRAAVVRFARKLGYEGFTELRDAARGALREERESPLGRFADADDDSLVARKAEQDARNLAATQTLAGDAIGGAAAVVAGARTVFLIGHRKSYGLALYIHRMLEAVRPNVRLVDPGFTDELAHVGSQDAVVACLFRRYSRLTISLMRLAKEAGASLVVVTDGRGHDFAADADHVLAAQAESPTLYDSMVAPMWLLETLVAEAAALDPERTRRTLAIVERHTEDLGVLLD